MELIRSIKQIKATHKGCVLTIGNFDGVHLGHCAVLDQLKKQARRLSLPSMVMVFEPQPIEFFRPDFAIPRLTHWREKYQLLRDQGIDYLLCVKFNADFAAMTSQAFIDDLLVGKLGIQHLVIGDDFKFGKGRTGDFGSLQQAGKALGFAVEDTKTYMLANERISSTRIRKYLEQGELAKAEQLLGREYSISGKVIHGAKLGRTIGFPTVNILLKRKATPVHGVFAVTCHIDGQLVTGVANIGRRPTVAGNRLQLEAHWFDYQGDLYGRELVVTLVAKIRDEQKFDSFELLKQQIQKDAQAAKQALQVLV